MVSPATAAAVEGPASLGSVCGFQTGFSLSFPSGGLLGFSLQGNTLPRHSVPVPVFSLPLALRLEAQTSPLPLQLLTRAYGFLFPACMSNLVCFSQHGQRRCFRIWAWR